MDYTEKDIFDGPMVIQLMDKGLSRENAIEGARAAHGIPRKTYSCSTHSEFLEKKNEDRVWDKWRENLEKNV